MKTNTSLWAYIAVMFVVTYLIRVLPLTLIRKEIKNRTIRSFLYYVPYVTLAVMTFPAILGATSCTMSAVLALAVGIALAALGKDLMIVSVACCVTVYISELFLL